MPTTYDVFNLFVMSALQHTADRHRDWCSCTFLGEDVFEDAVFGLDIHEVGQLDCLLIALENSKPSNEIEYFAGLQFSLNRVWIYHAYELLRTLKQRSLSQKKAFRKFNWEMSFGQVFKVLEEIRVLLAKRELVGFSKTKNGKQNLYVSGKTEDAVELYEHGKTNLHAPHISRKSDNSIGWLVYSQADDQNREIYRRDLSSTLLNAFLDMSEQSLSSKKNAP